MRRPSEVIESGPLVAVDITVDDSERRSRTLFVEHDDVSRPNSGRCGSGFHRWLGYESHRSGFVLVVPAENDETSVKSFH